jgi:hypothetical protein
MSYYATLFHPAPVTTVEVQISSTNTTGYKVNEHLTDSDLWLGNLSYLNLVYSTVHSRLQKYPYNVRGDIRQIYLSVSSEYAYKNNSQSVPDMNMEDYSKERLWQLLVETVHAAVMYPTHKAYIRDSILPTQKDISALTISEQLGMSLGEALVILDELSSDKQPTN